MQSSPGRAYCCGLGRKPTSPAQRQEMRTTWAASEPRRHLALAPKAAWLGLGSRHRWPCSVSSEGGNADPPQWCGGVSPLLAPLHRCSSGQRGRLQPELLRSSSFCWESALHPSSGTGPGSSCQCLAVTYARNKGNSWAVVCCLRPGPP